MVLGIPVYRIEGMQYYPVEIQLRTLAMDLWASMEHRICYKGEIPDETTAAFTRYSNELSEMERAKALIDEFFDREFRHAEAAARTVETLCIFIGAEDAYFAVFAAESLHTFKDRLTVVHTVGGNRHSNVVVVVQFEFTPLGVLETGTHVGAGRHEFKTEFVPFDIHNKLLVLIN